MQARILFISFAFSKGTDRVAQRSSKTASDTRKTFSRRSLRRKPSSPPSGNANPCDMGTSTAWNRISDATSMRGKLGCPVCKSGRDCIGEPNGDVRHSKIRRRCEGSLRSTSKKGLGRERLVQELSSTTRICPHSNTERTLDSPLDDTNMTNTRAYTRAYTPSAIEIVASTGKNTYGRASTIISNAIRSSKLVYSNLHTCTFANSSSQTRAGTKPAYLRR